MIHIRRSDPTDPFSQVTETRDRGLLADVSIGLVPLAGAPLVCVPGKTGLTALDSESTLL